MVNVNASRDKKTGKYTDSKLDKMCVCGHTLGAHSAAKVGTEQPCFHDGCDCDCFRKVGKK